MSQCVLTESIDDEIGTAILCNSYYEAAQQASRILEAQGRKVPDGFQDELEADGSYTCAGGPTFNITKLSPHLAAALTDTQKSLIADWVARRDPAEIAAAYPQGFSTPVDPVTLAAIQNYLKSLVS